MQKINQNNDKTINENFDDGSNNINISSTTNNKTNIHKMNNIMRNGSIACSFIAEGIEKDGFRKDGEVNDEKEEKEREEEKNKECWQINGKFPQYKYKTSSAIMIPFDLRETKGGKFSRLDEAVLFIAQHCQKHGQKFTPPVVHQYLRFCRIMNFVKGTYETVSNLKPGAFTAAYNYARKEIKYMP